MKSAKIIIFLALAALMFGALDRASADNTPQALPFTQNWTSTDASLATADDWSGVPGITGYRGDSLTTTVGADAQTVLAEDDTNITPLSPVIDVNIDQTTPDTFFTGGVAEFLITDPTVALNGSTTADAPYLQFSFITTGLENITVAFNARDLDSSTDSSVQQIGVHFRVGTSGTWTNVPSGYVADATTGPSLATLVTPVSALLPIAASDEAIVQVRIMTINATGNDEWVGIDDISITGSPIVPPGDDPNAVLTAPGPYGPISVNATEDQNLVVDNNGATQNLNVTGVTFGGPDAARFSVVGALPGPIAPGNNANIAIRYTPGGADGPHSATATLVSDDANAPAAVNLSGTTIPVVADLAAARALADGTTVEITGTVIVTSRRNGLNGAANRNQFYVQDASGVDGATAILIDDQPGIITYNFQKNDTITGLIGTLTTFGGVRELQPTAPAVRDSVGILPNPRVLTVPLGVNFAEVDGELIRINGVDIAETGTFAADTNYAFTAPPAFNPYTLRIEDASGAIGLAIPAAAFDVVGIQSIFGGVEQIQPRFASDILAPGAPDPDPNPPLAASGWQLYE